MSMQSNEPGKSVGASVSDVKAAAATTMTDLKDQAAQAADQAKGTLNAIASDARQKVNDIVDQQKSAGADQLSALSRAAQTAAGDLNDKSPQVARLVRDAASSVDHLAENLRNSDVRDVLASVSDFARQQPVAFFAGSVLLGLAMARFFKADAEPRSVSASRAYDTTPGYAGASSYTSRNAL